MTTGGQQRLAQTISMAMLAKVLRRNADARLVSTPEGNLIMAVISIALQDADARDFKLEARHFFVDGRLDYFAPPIGLNADFVRESIQKVRSWLPPYPLERGRSLVTRIKALRAAAASHKARKASNSK